MTFVGMIGTFHFDDAGTCNRRVGYTELSPSPIKQV